MRYSELVKDTEFKLVVNFISKKWIANFDKNGNYKEFFERVELAMRPVRLIKK